MKGELVIEKKDYTKLDGENIILDVNSEETVVIFKERFKKLKKKALVFYYAKWCGYCQQMLPEWDKLEEFAFKTEDLNKNFSIIRVDSEFFPKIGIDKTLEGYPTVTLYGEGIEIEDVAGKREVNQLLEYLHGKAYPEKEEEKEIKNESDKVQPNITTKANTQETEIKKENKQQENVEPMEKPEEATQINMNQKDNVKFVDIQKQVTEHKKLLDELKQEKELINDLKETERSIKKHKEELLREKYEYKF
jgi:thiol-disulfide isomerase/thioredoxin